jgi:hypothetical protein
MNIDKLRKYIKSGEYEHRQLALSRLIERRIPHLDKFEPDYETRRK